MRTFRFGKVIVIVTMLFFLGACQGRAMEIGATAADFSIGDIDYNKFSLAEYKGKVIILNFFATWCPPCRAEIPDFIDLQTEYAPKGVTFIGVSNEGVGLLRGFGAKMGINYPLLSDTEKKAMTRYGPIRGVPTTYIIGKDFKIARVYIGARSREVIEKDIKDLLSE
ncbi:MAG TPA: TlpA disulfide reductase family protein [Candidatus Omnitrophota bacterium]|nr:TlpA disulfide reductase family protein [Candidatus Omnitrophota bacterium]